DLVVHSRGGQFKSASLTLTTRERPDLAASVSAGEAIVAAGVHFGTGFQGVRSARQVVYARSARPVLAYEVVMNGIKRDQTPTEMHYFVDAKSGKVLDWWDKIETVDAV